MNTTHMQQYVKTALDKAKLALEWHYQNCALKPNVRLKEEYDIYIDGMNAINAALERLPSPAKAEQEGGVWVKATSIDVPDWYLGRLIGTEKKFPVRLAANLACDIAGKTYLKVDLEILTESTTPPVKQVEHTDDIETTWNTFWKDIVCNPDGTVNIEQLKKELHDFHFIMEQVPKVYCHVTGDTLSKLMYPAETVIRVADDHFNAMLEQEMKDRKDDQEIDEQSIEAAPVKEAADPETAAKEASALLLSAMKSAGLDNHIRIIANHEGIDYQLSFERVKEAGQPSILALQNLTLADIDAPTFTHTEEFRKHFDYIKDKFMEVLKDQPAPLGIRFVKGDYERLYEQVMAGTRTVCYLDNTSFNDNFPAPRDICTAKVFPEYIEFLSRGHGYATIWKDQSIDNFVKICESLNVEWLSDSPAQQTDWEAAYHKLFALYQPLRERADIDSPAPVQVDPALINAYKEYVKLLCDEIDGLVPLAHTHGWRSERHEKGIELRDKIKSLQNKP